MDPLTHCVIPYTPHGRFLHVAPAQPSSDWVNDFGLPWWKDHTYYIGNLSNKTRLIKVVNTLTSQDHVIEVSITQDRDQQLISRGVPPAPSVASPTQLLTDFFHCCKRQLITCKINILNSPPIKHRAVLQREK